MLEELFINSSYLDWKYIRIDKKLCVLQNHLQRELDRNMTVNWHKRCFVFIDKSTALHWKNTKSPHLCLPITRSYFPQSPYFIHKRKYLYGWLQNVLKHTFHWPKLLPTRGERRAVALVKFMKHNKIKTTVRRVTYNSKWNLKTWEVI